MEQKTICIDFDGVIHDYSKGWQGEDVFGQMIPNADTGTATLKKNGWTIIIFTTRKKTEKLEKWLAENNISYDHINENPNQPEHTSGKIIADVYLDDRGICFTVGISLSRHLPLHCRNQQYRLRSEYPIP